MNLIKLLPILIFTSCAQQEAEQQNAEPVSVAYQEAVDLEIEKDNGQVEEDLTAFIRRFYEYAIADAPIHFPYKLDSTDTLIMGINWTEYDSISRNLSSVGYFSDEFISFHRKLAERIESSIQMVPLTTRSNDGMTTWSTGADDWCACQDHPDNFWEDIVIYDVQSASTEAEFKWTWEDSGDLPQHDYQVRVSNEDGEWKISSLEGFKFLYDFVKR